MLPIPEADWAYEEGLWVYLFTRVRHSAVEALLLSLSIMALSWILSVPGVLALLKDSVGRQQLKQQSNLQ
ncbi:MAG: hypothetical protein AAGD25_33570 [Cyanobacteria bacterium P01_F01_bin.150]